MSPPAASVVTSASFHDIPPTWHGPAALRLELPVRRAEAAARGSKRRVGGGCGHFGPRRGQSRGHGAAAVGLGRAGAAGSAAMAGYARRPGFPPLSRAQSLTIPDGEWRGPGRAAGSWGWGPGPSSRAAAPHPGAPRPREVPPRRARRARGEVALVITAPAFYERRSCLPQLGCERPRGRDLDSHFFGIRPTFMCYVPSPVLASVGGTGERQAAGTHAPALP